MAVKNVIITGATSGIGWFTALGLAQQETSILVLGRNQQKGEELATELAALGAEAHFREADFSSMQSVRRAAAEANHLFDHIDILVNNAGQTCNNRQLTDDGFEMTFAVNHLAPFLFTNLLLPALQKSPVARIVNVTSEMHRRSNIHFKDLMLERGYSMLRAYNQSKLANVMFTYELARRLQQTNVTANCLHPGVVATRIARDFPAIITSVINLFMLSPEKGAEPSIYLATAGELAGVSGRYYNRLKEQKSSAESYEEAKAARLWDLSAHLVKL